MSATTNGSFSNESYSYDDNGNRTMSGYSTDTGNELSSDGTYNYTYDAAGNMTSKTDIATGVETDYVWDDRNRLVEVDQVVSGVNTVLALYTYDALNNPIKVVENGSTRWTAYDGNRPVLDFDGSGTLTARYLQGPMVDEVLARDTPSGGVAWYLPDRLGTVRDIIDNSGAVLDHIAYGAYGQILSQSNASAGDRFGYAGMQTDATTGLYFDQARWYDPGSGRFISQDPIMFSAGDSNLYRFVMNSPADYSDPLGLFLQQPDHAIPLPPLPGQLPDPTRQDLSQCSPEDFAKLRQIFKDQIDAQSKYLDSLQKQLELLQQEAAAAISANIAGIITINPAEFRRRLKEIYDLIFKKQQPERQRLNDEIKDAQAYLKKLKNSLEAIGAAECNKIFEKIRNKPAGGNNPKPASP